MILDTDRLLESVLDVIESQEAKLLVWGLVDGRISRTEIDEIIYPRIEKALEEGLEEFLDSESVISELKSRGLLFETDADPYQGYRSRMAETVRLAFRLRQLFPNHDSVDGWQRAKTLVSDFRFTRRLRRYPIRNTTPEELINDISSADDNLDQISILGELLSNRGSNYHLADFQVRALKRILESPRRGRSTGTLVSAGTGSGKTLAFYLPAITRVGELKLKQVQGIAWTKILALYPRTELLRDQFAEVYSEVRRLDTLLISNNSAKIKIGALFGDTPESNLTFKKPKNHNWRRVAEGFVCGYMTCVQKNCDGDLVWKSEDIDCKRERLFCSRCGNEIKEDEIAITRESLKKDPPDILLTTTEMLNQRLSDTATRHLFGLRPGAIRPPEMVLLDEVHTYSGNHGANVGYLLRRLSFLVRAPLTFVGLSATLQDGVSFFSRLTGLAEVMVEEISPRESEMISEGAEYLLALRGDPVSRAALLSTSIQTSMLMMRAMDPSNQSTSKGLFGKRVFAFTDDIDVTNRFYFGLMDAEGRNDRGDPDHGRHPNGPLAAIRRNMPSISRDRAGQNWTMASEIGHQLTERKRIGRTSSQDPGVVRGLDLIVATASLEVGFNDPGVGCVIQHKAPRDSAQFLQRKGRAGRPRGMRPWTVIILSDYGRDRLSYQGYEQLFEPEIRPRPLPLSSRYIQRMQATYALLDFLARELGPLLMKGSAWKSLSGPSKPNHTSGLENQRQCSLIGLLVRILEDPVGQSDIEEYLQEALKLKSKEVQPLLWEYPRPILTSVIPTAIRRLSSNWQYYDIENADFSIRNNPLPEFIPGNLFRDLNLPEVKISLPPDWESHEPEIQMIGIEQGMKTFAPGRVSRRYGVDYSRIRHWVAPEDAGREQTEINISDFYDSEFLGHWLIRNEEEAIQIPVFRPHEIRPLRPTSEIVDTSNAHLVWKTQICAKDRGVPLVTPSDSVWSELIGEVCCFRHADHAPVTVRRFSLGSEANIRVRGGESYQASFQYINESEQVALGFSLSVDAIRFGLKLPNNLWMRVANTPKLERAIRTEYYFNSDLTFSSLPMVENPFMRDWLVDIYFVALNQTALNEQIGLLDASDALAEETGCLAFNDVLESFFQSPPSANDESEQNQDNRNSEQLRQDLELFISRSDIRDALKSHSTCLWEPLNESWEPMLRQTFLSTLGSAAHAAITGLCSEVDPSSLILDLDPGPRESDDIYTEIEGKEEFWITETSPGGVGAIEEFFALFNEDPRIFYSLIESELQPNEYYQTDFQLRRLLSTLANEQDNNKLKEAITNVRKSDSSHTTEQAMVTFRKELADSGYVLYHGFISAITTRLLRSGATGELDSFLHDLALNWEHFEVNLGVDLDGRALAYFYSRNDEIDQILLNVGLTLPETEHRTSWRFNTIYGLLWRRGREVSRVGLESYNPFNKLLPSERLLVSSYLIKETDVIDISDTDWKELAIEKLASWGIVTLSVGLKDKSLLADALRFFAVNPIESAYLSIYARVAGFRNIENSVEVDLELEEVFR